MKITTTIKFLGFVIKQICIYMKRNIIRRHHVADHRMHEGSITPRFNRSEPFRRRYKGKHSFDVWKEAPWNQREDQRPTS